MNKLPETIKKFYQEEPELLEQRIFMDMEILEEMLKEHELMSFSKQAFEEWGHVWEVAKSYWIFPDMDDLKKHVDKFYIQKNPQSKI